MDQPVERQTSAAMGCLKWGGIGCLALFLLFIATGVAVMLNRDAIRDSSWFQSARNKAHEVGTEFSGLVNLSRELNERYPAQSIGVSSNIEVGRQRRLQITVTNPRFDIEGMEEESARDIAETAFDLYPEIADYDYVRVVFASSTGGVVSVSSSEHYDIPVGELGRGSGELTVPEAPEPPAEPPRGGDDNR